MAIEVVSEYLNTATVRIIAYVYNDSDALTDPTGITIEIWNPAGTRQLLDDPNYPIAMTQTATGIYEYYYHKGSGVNAMTSGRWRFTVTVVDGAGASAIYSTGSGSFKVR